MNTQGDAATNRLIGQYKEQKNYAKVDECYKTLISIARKANNAGLVARTYDKYILWTDSVKALTAQEELNALKKKYDESLATIQEKDDSLSAKQYIIIGLCILAAILAAAPYSAPSYCCVSSSSPVNRRRPSALLMSTMS